VCAGSCKIDDFVGDRLFDAIVAVPDPQRDARRFERETQNAPRLGIEPLAVKIKG
jgi:hypothetical protein